MEAQEAIDRLKSDLQAVKEKGRAEVNIVALEEYLKDLSGQAAESIELRKINTQLSLAHYDAKNKSGLEMFKSVLDAGREALNAIVLINGGAVVALLGFMGAAISKGFPPALGLSLSKPLLYFGSGVLLGAVAHGARYLSQHGYALNKKSTGDVFTVISIFSAIAANLVFGVALNGTHSAFVLHFSPGK